MKTFTSVKIWRTASVWASAALAAAAWATPLPPLVIDKTQTSVSGISSGGYMAVQLHVAYSATFKKGAGVVAGGPFYCAEGSVTNATGRCMAHSTSIPVAGLVAATSNWATQGLIDPTSNLTNSKVICSQARSTAPLKQRSWTT